MKTQTLSWAVIADMAALAGITIFSLFGAILWHIPAAISFVQLLALELFILVYPHVVQRREANQIIRRFATRSRLWFEAGIFGLLAASLAYGCYLLFYVWHGISPTYMDPANPLHSEATSLTFLALVLCQVANLFLFKADGNRRVFSWDLWSNKKFVRAVGVSLFVAITIVYFPFVHTFFGTEPLWYADWLALIITIGIYLSARLFQRQTRKHSRQVVLRLHRELNS